tara:strand:+ start:369 stop:1883 length:1515 start_codon:yes stop_codon:yes gene_type:complete
MSTTLASTHPLYTDHLPDWKQMRDTYKGERRVKSQSTTYLPATSGHIQDGYGGNNADAIGYQAYEAYKTRARYHNFVREAVQMAVGMMHNQPPRIELPEAMKNIRSSRNEKLEDFLRRINFEQLLTGRVGLMADLPLKPGDGPDQPILSLYGAERIINWDTGATELTFDELNLVVLDESTNIRKENFMWDKETQFRVLVLGKADENNPDGVYKQGLFTDTGFDESSMITPSYKGRSLEKIPFVILNSIDITAEPDDPVLLDLSNLCLTMYRSDADYRQNLFMQGQDTFVTIGGAFDEDDAVRTGAGARVDLPQGGDAKYVGVQSSGLAEQRQALDKLESRAGTMGAQTLDSTSRERESGDSMRQRVAARTADLNQIADAGAAALEEILRTCAVWMDEDPEEVKVTANKEFGEMPLTGQTMVEMATARTLGFPISAKSLHDLAMKRRITVRTFEEEMAEAIKEKEEEHPFAVPKKPDMAGADQNEEGDDTDDDASARTKAKKEAE